MAIKTTGSGGFIKFNGTGSGMRMVSSGGGGGGGFNPSTLGNLVAWYDASQITGVADGGVVSAWNDLSANANHLNMSRTGENSPLWLTAGTHGISLNGQPMVRFQGCSLYRSSPAGLPTGSGATSIYIVGRQTNGSNWSSNAMFGWGQSSAMWGIIKFGNGLFTAGNNNGTGYTNLFSKSGDSNPFLFSVQYSSGATYSGTPTYYNGEFGDSGVATTPNISSPVAEISMGGTPTDSSPVIDTYIAEVLVYNSAHSTGEKDQIQAYLAAKYGITI
jgi:hypothetical protein